MKVKISVPNFMLTTNFLEIGGFCFGESQRNQFSSAECDSKYNARYRLLFDGITFFKCNGEFNVNFSFHWHGLGSEVGFLRNITLGANLSNKTAGDFNIEKKLKPSNISALYKKGQCRDRYPLRFLVNFPTSQEMPLTLEKSFINYYRNGNQMEFMQLGKVKTSAIREEGKARTSFDGITEEGEPFKLLRLGLLLIPITSAL